jgi:hypothetical protein
MKNIIRIVAAGFMCCWICSSYAQTGAVTENKMKANSEQSVISDTTYVVSESRLDREPREIHESHNYDVPTLYIGARFMPTFTSLNFQKAEEGPLETTMVLGYGFGGLVGVNFSEHVGMQAEVIYTALAQKFKNNSKEQKVSLSYVNVPLMLVLNTNYSQPVNFNVCFGPQVGINTGSKIESGESNGTDTIHAVLAVKPVDIGFAYGAGLDFGSANFKISVGFRGVYGILDISDRSKSITTNEYYVLDRSHVKTYSGYIGVAFGF